MAEIKYTSENLYDIKCLREYLNEQIKECNTQKRILDGKIELLYETVGQLDRHINSIEVKDGRD